MIKLNSPHNKDFVFNMTLTELIIMLFFILLLISTFITMQKDDVIAKQDTMIDEQKKNIEHLTKKNEIQKNVSIDMLEEVLKYKIQKKVLKDCSKNLEKNLDTMFIELTREKELILENKNLTKIIANYKKQVKLNKIDEELDKLIRIKKDLLIKVGAIKDEKDLNEIIDTLQKLKSENEKLKFLSTKKDIEINKFTEELKKLQNLFKVNQELELELESCKKTLTDSQLFKTEKELIDFLDYKKNKLEYSKLNKDNDSLRYKNTTLNGQVKYLVKRLNNVLGGNELPPCWVNTETSKPEYIFAIYIHERDLVIKRSWKDYRNIEIKKYKNIKKIINKRMKIEKFMKLSLEIYLDSKRNKCKHFVEIYDNAVSKNGYKKQRLRIENYFYKYEHRNND